MHCARPLARLAFATSLLALLAALSFPGPLFAEPLRARGDATYPPYEFLDEGVPSGFNVDLMRAVAEVMGLELDIRLGPWSEVRSELEDGKIDALTGMFYSERRARLVDFSEPFILVSHAIFVRNDSPVKDAEDLAHARILVERGDIMDDWAREEFPEADITAVANQVEALRLLSKGGYDAALLGKLQGYYWMHKLAIADVKDVGPALSPLRYCFAVANGRPGLVSKLNEGLAILRKSGRYEEIYQKWFGAYERKSALDLVLRYAAYAAAPIFLLFATIFLWNWSLRRRVARKTGELSKALAASRESEIALRESEERYRAVFENIMDGYYQADMNGRVVWCNPAAARMFGFERPEDAFGCEISGVYADPDQRGELMRRLLRDGVARGFQTKLRRIDGECFMAEANSSLMRDSSTGAPCGVEGVVRDITRRKRMEEIMAQTEKMLSVGGLAAGMAHEINNPLCAILASCQNLSRRLSLDFPKTRERIEECGLDPEALRAFLSSGDVPRMLEGVTEAAERAARIVRNMLEFSRHDGDRRLVCDVGAVLDKAVELAQADPALKGAQGRRIEIVREYSDTRICARINDTGIAQVVINLIRNAAQAMNAENAPAAPDAPGASDEPHIILRASRLRDKAVIEVEDNGPGMDESTRKRAFEPFFTTKAPGVGTGLGLSVSYFIVTQSHEGEIHLESQPGKGTKFTILLPVTDESPGE